MFCKLFKLDFLFKVWSTYGIFIAIMSSPLILDILLLHSDLYNRNFDITFGFQAM